MIDNDEYYMRLALAEAQEAFDAGNPYRCGNSR